MRGNTGLNTPKCGEYQDINGSVMVYLDKIVEFKKNTTGKYHFRRW